MLFPCCITYVDASHDIDKRAHMTTHTTTPTLLSRVQGTDHTSLTHVNLPNTHDFRFDPTATCRGKAVMCQSGTCTSGVKGGDLCVSTERVGGASILLNVETSVAGFALVEVQQEDGSTVPGMSLNDAAPIRGSAL